MLTMTRKSRSEKNDAPKRGRPSRPLSDLSARVRCLSVADLVAAGLGSKSDIYRKVESGEFPAPFKHGGLTLWRESAIVAWLDKKQPVKQSKAG